MALDEMAFLASTISIAILRYYIRRTGFENDYDTWAKALQVT